MSETYVHGYDPREGERLQDQAGTLVDLLHSDTAYPAGSTVLEAGCGVGAQTVTLAQRSPDARFTSIDVSADSIAEARRKTDAAGLTNVRVPPGGHLRPAVRRRVLRPRLRLLRPGAPPRPVEALAILDGLLKPGGTITVIEGDHGSAYFHPDSAAAHAAIQCQVELQRRPAATR